MQVKASSRKGMYKRRFVVVRPPAVAEEVLVGGEVSEGESKRRREESSPRPPPPSVHQENVEDESVIVADTEIDSNEGNVDATESTTYSLLEKILHHLLA